MENRGGIIRHLLLAVCKRTLLPLPRAGYPPRITFYHTFHSLNHPLCPRFPHLFLLYAKGARLRLLWMLVNFTQHVYSLRFTVPSPNANHNGVTNFHSFQEVGKVDRRRMCASGSVHQNTSCTDNTFFIGPNGSLHTPSASGGAHPARMTALISAALHIPLFIQKAFMASMM